MQSVYLVGIVSALLFHGERAHAQDEGEPEPDPSEQAAGEGDLVFYGTGVGAYRLRVNFVDELPLSPPVPDTDPRETDELGQELWAEQWFRIRIEMGFRDRVRLVGETGAFDGLVVGDFSQGVEAALRPRDSATAFPGIRPRALYLEWTPEFGRMQAGLTPAHWGLGIVDNDGAHEPPFGDYRYGDIVTRVAVTAQPWGESSPVHLGVAGDLVFEDQRADIRDGDLAWRGVVVAAYRKDERRAGFYAAYRHQRSEVERGEREVADTTDAVTLDAFVRWDFDDAAFGELFGAVEAAYTHARAVLEGPLTRPDRGRDELAVVAQAGKRSAHTDVVFEFGYASDGGLDRAVIHPDHRVGLLLFPEVIAWQTARAATLLELEALEGPVPRGTALTPTQGGVAGAVYLFPTVTWRIARWMRLRVGAVWAHAVTDVVDPYRLTVRGVRANFRGGDPGNRDLGLELDGRVHAESELAPGILLSAGVEGAWLLPGHAFDDAEGKTMDPMGLLRLRMGLTF